MRRHLLRTLALLLCVALMLSLIACEQKNTTPTQPQATEDGKVSSSLGVRDMTEAEKMYGVLYNGEPYTLRIDLNTLMPSEDHAVGI